MRIPGCAANRNITRNYGHNKAQQHGQSRQSRLFWVFQSGIWFSKWLIALIRPNSPPTHDLSRELWSQHLRTCTVDLPSPLGNPRLRPNGSHYLPPGLTMRGSASRLSPNFMAMRWTIDQQPHYPLLPYAISKISAGP